jgi:hypothetical protein
MKALYCAPSRPFPKGSACFEVRARYVIIRSDERRALGIDSTVDTLSPMQTFVAFLCQCPRPYSEGQRSTRSARGSVLLSTGRRGHLVTVWLPSVPVKTPARSPRPYSEG